MMLAAVPVPFTLLCAADLRAPSRPVLIRASVPVDDRGGPGQDARMIRTTALFTALLLLVSADGLRPAAAEAAEDLVHHEIVAKLDPTKHTIHVTDTLTFVGGTHRVHAHVVHRLQHKPR